jgi:hypothetical protein
MLDAIQQQLLATLTATHTAPSADVPERANTVYHLLTALVEESLMYNTGASAVAWLDWQFAVDATDSHSYEIDVQTAGTYQLVGQTNCASISVEVEERAVTIPFTIKVGERLKIAIRRDIPGIASVQFLRIGVYRQLIAY